MTFLKKIEGRTIDAKFCDECRAFYIVFFNKPKITKCKNCNTILKKSIIKIEKVEEGK